MELIIIEQNIIVRAYGKEDNDAMVKIWNEVVDEGIAFPQEDFLDQVSGIDFLGEQTYCGIAEDNGEVVGLYILHPDNVGRFRQQNEVRYL